MNRILVIGGTGNVGRHVVSQLAARRARFRVMTRNPDGVNLPPLVEAVRGDLTVPESLERCLQDADTVFLVWVAPPAAAEDALRQIAEHARRVVFLTAPLKTPHPFFQQPNPSRDMAERIERLIETSGMEWTFLRAGLFAGNARHFWGPQIRGGGVVRWPYLDVHTAPTDERDLAAAACVALCEDGHAGFIKAVHGFRYQVKDVERAVAFYTQRLGFTLKHQQLPAFANVSLGETDILLSGPGASGSRQMPNGQRQEPGGWNRIVLKVTDLPACIAELKHAGVTFRNEMEAGPGGRQIQIEDPDGNPLELFEPAARR